jgi:photosystem II stability/assembly factor-like uncharacterized protein
MLPNHDLQQSIFLAATPGQLTRVVQRPQGKWLVDYPLNNYDVRCLAVDPLNPSVVYAGTQDKGILRSEDHGATWRPAGLANRSVKSLAVSNTEPGTIYAGTKPAWLFVSRDNGATWAEVESFRHIRGRWHWASPVEKPFQAYVQGIALSPTDSGVIVVGIEFGAVVRSIDGGQTWSGHRKGAIMDCHSLVFHAERRNLDTI